MRRRARGQTIVIAAIAMVAVVGAVAMVIDAGMFFVIQRQLQSAADAGALAGAWYDPICLKPAVGCLPPGPGGPTAQQIAREVALANAQTIDGLCVGGASVPTPSAGTPCTCRSASMRSW